MEWDSQQFYEKALNAVSLANKVGHKQSFSPINDTLQNDCYSNGNTLHLLTHAAIWQECMSAYGLYLKIRVLLRAGALDEAIAAGKILLTTPLCLNSE